MAKTDLIGAFTKLDFVDDVATARNLLTSSQAEKWLGGMELGKVESAVDSLTVPAWEALLEQNESDRPGGQLTNRPPSTLQVENFAPGRQAGGVDWLEMSVYGEHDPEKWNLLAALLRSAKKEAATRKEGFALMKIPGHETVLAIAPGSVGRGYGYAAFTFVRDGITYGLVDRRTSGGEVTSGKGGVPIVYVRATGVTCLLLGWRGVVARAKHVLGLLGFTWHNEAVSRLDVCIDVLSHDVRRYQKMFNNDHVIRLSRKWAMWGNGGPDGLQTLRLGSTDGLTCRVYDKMAEVADDPFRLACLRRYRWGICSGDPDPWVATRIEFQLRRDDLKSQGLYTLENVGEGLGTVLQYLTNDWLRFTAGPVDRRHTDRALTSGEWLEVQRLGEEVAAAKSDFSRRRLPRLPATKKELDAIIVGLLGKVFGLMDVLPSTQEAVVNAVSRWVNDHWRKVGFKAALARLHLENTVPGQGHKIQEAWVRAVRPLEPGFDSLAAIAGM